MSRNLNWLGGRWRATRGVVAIAIFFATVCAAGGFEPVAGAAQQRPARRGPLPKQRDPLARVGEVLRWLSWEQQKDGSWKYFCWRGLEAHLGHAGAPPPFPPGAPTGQSVPDTALAGLALIRSGSTTTSGAHRENVFAAADFLYKRVAACSAESLTVSTPTPLTARIGPYADTALALLFFAELRDSASPDLRFDGMMQKCIDKLQKNQNADGSWGGPKNGASHAPLLGHALAVWALESAYRKGADKIDPAVLARAGQYALSQAAVDNERRTNGKWKKDARAKPPEWLTRAGADDEEPINYEVYMNAARLNVLYQADRSNRHTLDRELRAGGDDSAALARVKRLAKASSGTRKALDDARQLVSEGWIKAHGRDLHPSPAPLLFTGEDFLACLLTVDAMAERRDVEKWFPPVVRRLMHFQDVDGGLRSDQHIMCLVLSDDIKCCDECNEAPDLARLNEGMIGGAGLELPRPEDLGKNAHVVRGGGYEFCPAQLAWCSKDRVFMTAAGTMALLADTPYRAAFLGVDGKPQGKAAKPAKGAKPAKPKRAVNEKN